MKNMVKFLCEIAGVSRSGYYNYFRLESVRTTRNVKKEKDEIAKENILKAFHFKSRKKGARQIKMTLAGQFNVVYNLKRIRRIMKKYNIVCPIRKANPYRRMMKATQEHQVVPNLLNRQFKQEITGKSASYRYHLLYYYGKGQKAYLSTIKDGSTNEILAYNVSDRITMELATDTLTKAKEE